MTGANREGEECGGTGQPPDQAQDLAKGQRYPRSFKVLTCLIVGLVVAYVSYRLWPRHHADSTGEYLKMARAADPSQRWRAIVDLSKRLDQPGAMQAVLAALSDESSHVRMAAAWGLVEAGPAAGPAVPALIRATRDPHPIVRWMAVDALARTGVRNKAVAEALLEALDDEPAGTVALIALVEMIKAEPGRD